MTPTESAADVILAIVIGIALALLAAHELGAIWQ